jgi:hypothetical protein
MFLIVGNGWERSALDRAGTDAETEQDYFPAKAEGRWLVKVPPTRESIPNLGINGGGAGDRPCFTAAAGFALTRSSKIGLDQMTSPPSHAA